MSVFLISRRVYWTKEGDEGERERYGSHAVIFPSSVFFFVFNKNGPFSL